MRKRRCIVNFCIHSLDEDITEKTCEECRHYWEVTEDKPGVNLSKKILKKMGRKHQHVQQEQRPRQVYASDLMSGEKYSIQYCNTPPEAITFLHEDSEREWFWCRSGRGQIQKRSYADAGLKSYSPGNWNESNFTVAIKPKHGHPVCCHRCCLL